MPKATEETEERYGPKEAAEDLKVLRATLSPLAQRHSFLKKELDGQFTNINSAIMLLQECSCLSQIE